MRPISQVNHVSTVRHIGGTVSALKFGYGASSPAYLRLLVVLAILYTVIVIDRY